MTLAKSLALAAALVASSPAGAATFVLVHGAYQDSRIWTHVASDLKARGHGVMMIDLPGHGRNPGRPASLSLHQYRDAITQVVSKSQEPVILVGHGSSGVVISAVAEAVPARIAGLVYAAAYVPRHGQSVMDLSLADTAKAITPANWKTDDAKTVGYVAEAERPAIFCGDCSEALQDYIRKSSQPEPLRPMYDPVALAPERFGKVRKAYVITTLNRAVSPAYQRAMANAYGLRAYSLNTSHSPFFSQPDRLARILMMEAAQ